MTALQRITMTKETDGTWTVTRQRSNNGESACGFRTLKLALSYIEAHDVGWWAEEEAKQRAIKEAAADQKDS